ncbi:MAG: oxygen-independent coproporphyrinogen III oxidase [Deltaproteobacteria bacterium]|nr:oxygen-independent coproporphyrinogen III oxidase [Deltaproteobacteria bacterium]
MRADPMITAECLADASTRGPRYTSYPPATHFGPIAAATVARELEALRADGPASLYLHVPFCKSLCWYCGCNVIPSRDTSRGDGYVDVLATEMALYAERLGPAFPIAEIALGGGSPNFLTPHAVRTLLAALTRYFDLSKTARRSVELDPRSTTASQLEVFATAGFRTLSIGVQDFSPSVQDAIHRHQSRTQTKWLVNEARELGFRDLNVDIVYGLPRQSEHSFAETLDAVVELAPERIALFGYAHLPSKLPHQALVERAGRVLDRYERATLLLLGIEQLTRVGYIHIGLDHFAKPGSPLARAAAEKRVVRTFQGYVERVAETILGFGTSAISSTRRAYWQNHAELADWERAIAAQHLPIARGMTLDDDDRIRRALINELMCAGEIDLHELGRKHDIDAEALFSTELTALDPTLATYDPRTRTIATTEVGRLLVRNVCMGFDRYLQPVTDEPRFSSTI